jgi:hypothetical protein
VARPNEGKTKNRVHLWIHQDLLKLLEARKDFLANDGQKFAKNATRVDISKEFVEHYWRLAGGTIVGRRMKKFFNLKIPKKI